LQDPALPVSVF